MKRYLAAIALILGIFTAEAQTTLSGKVVDGTTKSSVGYATVALLRDTTIVSAVAARADGTFSIETKEQGNMTLEVSSVGYNTVKRDVNVGGKHIKVGDIIISEGVTVDAVAVTIQKPIVTADAEKLTYSVEDDPESSTSTLEEIIRKVPQLSIDGEGKVLMNGQSDYKVLVNGRTSSSMSRNFTEIIKSMPASSIKRIEVVTNPSMKYDSEGSGGVLNIITTKSKFDGYNGRINLAAGNWFNRNFNTSNSAQFTVQTEKFSLSTSLYYSQAWATKDAVGIQESSTENLIGTPYRFLSTKGSYGYNYHSLYGNVNASYQIDSLNLITAEASVWGGESRSKMSDIEYRYFDDSHNLLYGYKAPFHNIYEWIGVDFALNYQHSFGRDNHTLAISDNISVTPPSDSGSSQLVYDLDGTTLLSQIDNLQLERGINNVVQIDYNNAINKHHSIEAGAKHTFDNSILKNSQYITDSSQPEEFGITEQNKHILGIYAGYSYTKDKFSTRFGGRLEGAWYNTIYNNNGTQRQFNNALVNAVPYIAFNYMPKTGHSLALSYNERLSRPSINSMTPFISETVGQRNYGNPNLRTGVTHNILFKYSYFNNKWSATAEVRTSLSNNQISTYSFFDSEGIANQTYKNGAHLRVYGLLGTMSYRPSSKFNLSMSVASGYIERSMPSENISAKGFSFAHNLSATVALWKGARLTLSEFVYRPEPQMGSVYTNWVVGTSVRFGQKLLKEKMEISLAVNNPHAKYTDQKRVSTAPTYTQHRNDRTVGRNIRLSVSYNFGKQGLYVKRTNRKADDGGDSVGGSSKGATNM